MSTEPKDLKSDEVKERSNAVGQSSSAETKEASQHAQSARPQLTGKAMAYLAALATAQAAAASPGQDVDRTHLEALLHGSWTQPANLVEGNPAALETNVAQLADKEGRGDYARDSGFNDSGNPHPTPYHDTNYADSGFGDRSP